MHHVRRALAGALLFLAAALGLAVAFGTSADPFQAAPETPELTLAFGAALTFVGLLLWPHGPRDA